MKKSFLFSLAMAASLVVPTTITQHEVHAKETPILEFPVLSDTHINAGETNSRLEKVLKDYRSISPNYDALAIVGDVTDNGMVEQYKTFNSLLYSHLTPSKSEKIITIGNHDFYEKLDIYKKPKPLSDQDMVKRFLHYTDMKVKSPKQKSYYDQWIKGYHFIVLGGEGITNKDWETAQISDQQVKWLEKKLAEDASHDKPIFVFLHQPLNNTVYGSEKQWNAGSHNNRLFDVLNDYPQVILFTGHTHYSLKHPKSVYYNDFTMVNTGSVRYSYSETDDLSYLSQSWFVEVYKDRIELKAREYDSKANQFEWIRNETIDIPDLAKKQTGWVEEYGSWYYYDENGKKKHGWLFDQGKWYFLGNGYANKTTWDLDANQWSYSRVPSNGVMQKGWINEGTKWYYLNQDGSMKTGWLYDDNKWYYLNSSGEMVTGTHYIDGKYYTFDSSGAMK